jgi:hypothetical protein
VQQTESRHLSPVPAVKKGNVWIHGLFAQQALRINSSVQPGKKEIVPDDGIF